tara:strand:- start:5113 stop:5484 length:372 start_codon:yes stop_codon:yes gene_type:complete
MSVKPLKVGQTFIVERDRKSFSKKEKPKNNKETKHYYYEDKSGNVDVQDLMKVLLNKIDSLTSKNHITEDIYGDKKMKAVDVDFKRDIHLTKLDDSKITSKEIKGKVNNKLDKLKALRKRNGS